MIFLRKKYFYMMEKRPQTTNHFSLKNCNEILSKKSYFYTPIFQKNWHNPVSPILLHDWRSPHILIKAKKPKSRSEWEADNLAVNKCDRAYAVHNLIALLFCITTSFRDAGVDVDGSMSIFVCTQKWEKY